MRSPYNLLQEIYHPDEWKILVCCMFLNQTTRLQVDRIRDEFFNRWPNARAASQADPIEMSHVIKPLGLYNKRSRSIIRMSHEYLTVNWTEPTELHGLGKYAQDSYDIFIRKRLDVQNPADKFLSKYLAWARVNF
jgi:methyl-CpG-binding domain protein 4